MGEDVPGSVRAWLDGLGLGQYADVFEQNAIDFDVLPDLTDKEFDRLGVLLGHRLRLSRAIAELSARTASAAAPRNVPTPQGPSPERRQLTVMFCDLVASTALAQKLDPEDLRGLIQTYQQMCGQVVARFDGHVAQYLGDGVMVYFGWPRAHEDNASRAIRVGLEIIEAVREIAAPEPLHVRIGVATGPVVVGETGAGDAAVPKAAVGETPNLAARVQGLAGADQIVIAHTTRQLAAGAFEYEDLGEDTLKGFVEPVRVWRVLRESRAEGRFAAARGAALTPLVDREADIALLFDRWSQASRGQGQAVLLLGEPGIGKSRIVEEFSERATTPYIVIRLQCLEPYANSAFHPLIAWLQRAADIRRDDAPADKLAKLESLLSGIGAPRERVAPYFAALLSLPLDRVLALRLSPQKRKQETIDAFATMVVAAARSKPVLVVFEDLQWVGPSMLEVVDTIVEAIRDAAVLLVMTARPEFAASWGARPDVTVHSVEGLRRDHSRQLVGAVMASKRLPARILDQILARTDGVPLFLEEVTRNILESVLSRDRGDEDACLAGLEVPFTLKDSLAARLDQLGPAKKIAQIGAVFGREFRPDLVATLADSTETEMGESLHRLVSSGLVTGCGGAVGATYTFRHALIQDAAYESLLKSELRTLHRRAGDLLSERFPEMTESEPEVLARHYTVGDEPVKATQLWLAAGRKAWQRSAAKEAIAHLTAGLKLVGRVPETAGRDALELGLQSALGVVYFAAVSYAAPQAQSAFRRAYELLERVPEAELKVPVLYGIGAFQTMKGDMRAGHDAFEKLLVEAKASGQLRLQLYAHSALAWSNYNGARYTEGIAHAQEAAALYAAGTLAGPRLSAADPKIISESFRAASLWSLGFADQARAASDGVLEHARALGDPYSLVYALTFGAVLVPELCGEHERVVERTGEGIQLARETGYPFMEVFGTLWRAWVVVQSGDAALTMIDEALARSRALGVQYHQARLLARRARLLVRVGRLDEARTAAEDALAHVEASGERSTEVDAHLAKGDVLLAAGPHEGETAESRYRRALDVARAQGARAWELRAATALAGLLAECGQRAEAHELLGPVYAWLTEGKDTADLTAATAQLAALR